ncbi:unnamed protein product [Rotaria sordida]|uniref:Zinc finger MYM-type protein 1-like n=1 Tax=Rotaria sordida TaxID=392033 RepID=A0A815RXM1_9BILA|nr:unnamed protein product [Rotaria sordida]
MDVFKLIDIEHKQKTSENRNYLNEIIRIIIFLSKQGLPFRRHHANDDSENKKWLKKLDLDIKYVVGQCFDGANFMRGSCKDIASRISQIVPTASYVHCNVHILNLYLVDVLEAVVHVRNSFGIVKSLYNLIEASPKQHKVFEDLQKEVEIVSITLKQSCDIRWTCRRIRTYLRNTTGQERLSSLALINIEKDYRIDIDTVATDFVPKKDERKRIF